MKIKTFIILVYIGAGLLISTLSAFTTFLIIGEPIGSKMFLQIVFSIIFMLPLIGLISYIMGRYLALKFKQTLGRLEKIKEGNFLEYNEYNYILEVNEINTSMNYLSKQLDGLINNLKLKNQNLSNLLISMSHDIKTPITIINGYIEEIEDNLIKKEELPAVLSHMKTEVNFLNELTIDMMSYISSMQENKEKTNINLFTFINEEVFPLLSIKEEIVYINEIDKKLLIKFNRMDLKKVCLNLFSNALKHTKKGYIKISNEKENIEFENNGTKIDLKLKEKIFEPFFTISKSKNRKEDGFGLGLSIVKNLSNNNLYNCYLKNSENTTTFCLEQK